MYGKTIWVIGIIAVVIASHAIFTVIDDMTQLGQFLSYILNTLLYCGTITVGIIIPFIAYIKKQLQE